MEKFKEKINSFRKIPHHDEGDGCPVIYTDESIWNVIKNYLAQCGYIGIGIGDENKIEFVLRNNVNITLYREPDTGRIYSTLRDIISLNYVCANHGPVNSRIYFNSCDIKDDTSFCLQLSFNINDTIAYFRILIVKLTLFGREESDIALVVKYHNYVSYDPICNMVKLIHYRI